MAVLYRVMIALALVFVIVVIFCFAQVVIQLPDDTDFCKHYVSVLVQSDEYALVLCFTVITFFITRKVSNSKAAAWSISSLDSEPHAGVHNFEKQQQHQKRALFRVWLFLIIFSISQISLLAYSILLNVRKPENCNYPYSRPAVNFILWVTFKSIENFVWVIALISMLWPHNLCTKLTCKKQPKITKSEESSSDTVEEESSDKYNRPANIERTSSLKVFTEKLRNSLRPVSQEQNEFFPSNFLEQKAASLYNSA